MRNLLRELLWRLLDSRRDYDAMIERAAEAALELHATETAVYRAIGPIGLHVVRDTRKAIRKTWDS